LHHAEKALKASTVEECYVEVRTFFAVIRDKLAELQKKERAHD